MAETPHGTRARYQLTRCRCTPCRAAEAHYRASLRRQRLRGLRPLGATISAVEARRQIRLILVEQYTKTEVARRLGLHRSLARLNHQPRITLRTALKIRRFYQFAILDGLDTEQDGAKAGQAWPDPQGGDAEGPSHPKEAGPTASPAES